MAIHKEGTIIILIVLLVVACLNLIFYWTLHNTYLQAVLVIASIVFFMLVIWFFRDPARPVIPDESVILCPADGKVLVIEEVTEREYFKDRRIQVSIFMSPLNVHINRYPVSGVVSYFKYHPGKYLVAWHPKSSEFNERSTVVVNDEKGREVLVRQIAGTVARRIVSYAFQGKKVIQGEELGFIKFGSRVDLFLPLNAKIAVNIGDKVTGNRTVIGNFQN
jgi:phosphatidylserine decarboxylase